jgi:hypothetical protein
MLQAMNTGHAGSMATVHANSAADALVRLEGMALLAGVPLPAAQAQVAAALDLVVALARDRGRRGASRRCSRSRSRTDGPPRPARSGRERRRRRGGAGPRAGAPAPGRRRTGGRGSTSGARARRAVDLAQRTGAALLPPCRAPPTPTRTPPGRAGRSTSPAPRPARSPAGSCRAAAARARARRDARLDLVAFYTQPLGWPSARWCWSCSPPARPSWPSCCAGSAAPPRWPGAATARRARRGARGRVGDHLAARAARRDPRRPPRHLGVRTSPTSTRSRTSPPPRWPAAWAAPGPARRRRGPRDLAGPLRRLALALDLGTTQDLPAPAPLDRVATVLITAADVGAPVGPALRRLAVELRAEDLARALAAAERLPAQLTFPTALCLLPAVLVAIGAPLAHAGLLAAGT